MGLFSTHKKAYFPWSEGVRRMEFHNDKKNCFTLSDSFLEPPFNFQLGKAMISFNQKTSWIMLKSSSFILLKKL